MCGWGYTSVSHATLGSHVQQQKFSCSCMYTEAKLDGHCGEKAQKVFYTGISGLERSTLDDHMMLPVLVVHNT